MAGEILVAKKSFLYAGGLVPKGATVRASHPMIEGREHLFEAATVRFEHEPVDRARNVEEATAAPGEVRELPVKRGPGRPRKETV